MKKGIVAVFTGLVFALSFQSCATLQKDIVMSTDSYIENDDIAFLEEKYTKYDAVSILGGRITVDTDIYKEIDSLEKEIEATIKASGVNKILDSRLYALDGLANLLQGKKQKAKTLYTKSLEENKGDSYTIVLGSRLGEIESLEDENVISGSNQSVILLLEQGLIAYRNGEYTDCVAKLDSAFIDLPEYYRTSYSEIRQNAWDLRNNSSMTDNKNILALLNKSQLTVGEMALITQETTDLLHTVTGGEKFSETELFNRLKNASYLDSGLKKNNVVVRSIAANFLWNINCAKKNLGEEKNRNSTLYREKIGYSPIPDVDLNSNDFDAILGVVEQEIMSLPDGVNFLPDGAVSAAEFNNWLQQIR